MLLVWGLGCEIKCSGFDRIIGIGNQLDSLG